MYCINCGVKLADSEARCPLCGTVVFHPELSRPEGERLYPVNKRPAPRANAWGVMTVLTVLFVLPAAVLLLCDFQISGSITWSGYVVGSMIVAYISLFLPQWFARANPVIFVPVAFAAVGLFLLYISYATGGGWFLSFAFPVTGGAALIATSVTALLRYVRGGRLYIIGGALLAAGGFMLLVEFLLNCTFGLRHGIVWAWYPLLVLGVVGALLLLIAICRPIRESLQRKFFL